MVNSLKSHTKPTASSMIPAVEVGPAVIFLISMTVNAIALGLY